MEIKRSDAEPVFILASCWRSGSTLLQRMCMDEHFIWGEPYGTSGTIPALHDTIYPLIVEMKNAFARSYQDPGEKFIYNGKELLPDLQERFVANLTPDFQTLVNAHVAFFETLFARQEKWGMKEVRLDHDHATYLRYLFPKAKIVFLYRNPYDCWRSIHRWISPVKEYVLSENRMEVRRGGNRLYDRWSDKEITEANFGNHWRYLTQGFIERAELLDAHLIRYEDLHDEKILDSLEDYLGFRLSRTAFENRPYDGFGGSTPMVDMELIREQVEPLAAHCGYVDNEYKMINDSKPAFKEISIYG